MFQLITENSTGWMLFALFILHVFLCVRMCFALFIIPTNCDAINFNTFVKQVEVCRSQHTQTWLGVLYIYKGLLLVVGVYMAWETRHVKIPALNDSQYIGVSVYSVLVTSAIVVVLANLISERVTLAFLTITALILTSTTATLCLLFLPKMQDIWGKGKLMVFLFFFPLIYGRFSTTNLHIHLLWQIKIITLTASRVMCVT